MENREILDKVKVGRPDYLHIHSIMWNYRYPNSRHFLTFNDRQVIKDNKNRVGREDCVTTAYQMAIRHWSDVAQSNLKSSLI